MLLCFACFSLVAAVAFISLLSTATIEAETIKWNGSGGIMADDSNQKRIRISTWLFDDDDDDDNSERTELQVANDDTDDYNDYVDETDDYDYDYEND